MATPFHLPVTAAQVGTYFVGQYYQMLQLQPDLVFQFYSDMSTMIRIDGSKRDTASAMLQIHALVMSLNYTGIEIKTAHSLESWNGGVLVMVTGYMHAKDFNGRRKFVQTFFLAPQEKGYFVFNDIFHYIEDDPIYQPHPVTFLPQNILPSKLNASTAIREPVSNYMLSGDIMAREFVGPTNIEENGSVDNYSFPEQRLQMVPEAENVLEDNFAVNSNGSLQISGTQEQFPTPVEEPAAEPQKHTYASILQVAKGKSAPSVSPHPPFNNTSPPSSEWQHHVPDPPSHQSIAQSTTAERSGSEAVDDSSAVDDDVEIKSVYVRNLSSSTSASEIEEEFKKFGKIKPDGVAIRTRKDVDVYYAFVEFEGITGVQNAIKASTVQIAGQQLYIEGRRAGRNSTFRGRGRGGRGRGGYQTEAPRGRYGGRRGNSQQDGDYNRSRASNGYYRQVSRQDSGTL